MGLNRGGGEDPPNVLRPDVSHEEANAAARDLVVADDIIDDATDSAAYVRDLIANGV